MNHKEAQALGFTLVAGQVDFAGENCGELTPVGVNFNPRGEEILKTLTPVARVEEKASAPKKPKKETLVVAPIPEDMPVQPPAPVDNPFEDLLSDLPSVDE